MDSKGRSARLQKSVKDPFQSYNQMDGGPVCKTVQSIPWICGLNSQVPFQVDIFTIPCLSLFSNVFLQVYIRSLGISHERLHGRIPIPHLTMLTPPAIDVFAKKYDERSSSDPIPGVMNIHASIKQIVELADFSHEHVILAVRFFRFCNVVRTGLGSHYSRGIVVPQRDIRQFVPQSVKPMSSGSLYAQS